MTLSPVVKHGKSKLSDAYLGSEMMKIIPHLSPLLLRRSCEDPRYTAEILLGLEIKTASTPHPTQTWHGGDGSDAFEPKWRKQSYHTAAEIEHFNAPPF